jgi:hypothetical protein
MADRLDDAALVADQAVILARARTERGHEAWGLRLLGEIHAHPSRVEREPAAADYPQATQLAEELRVRPLAAHCHLASPSSIAAPATGRRPMNI